MKKVVLLMLTSLLLGGCNGMSNEGAGAITGAALGGLLGSRFGHGSGRIAATAGGGILRDYYR